MASVKKNFVYNSLYQILNILIPLITTPYISRVIKAEGVGIYSFAYSNAHYFVLFILLGLNNYGNRLIAETRDDRPLLSKNFCNVYATQLFLGIVLSGFYVIYVFCIADNQIVALLLGLYVLSGIFDVNWFLFGLEQFKLTTIRNIIVKLLTTICIFVFVNDVSDIYVYCFIMSASLLISQIVVWPYVVKQVDFCKPTWLEMKKHIKPNLLLFSTTLAVSLFKVMDKIMLGVISNKTEVGWYESSEKVINIPIAFVTALGVVMLPHMTNQIAKNKEDNKILRASLLFAIFMSSSLCFGIMSVAEEFVPLFYGEGYDKCVILFKVLLPSCLFLAFANVVRTQYMLPHKMDKEYVTSAFLGAGTNIVLNIILIPHFQSVGAAIGTLFAEAVVCVYQCYKVRKNIPIGKYAVQILPMLFASVVMYVALQFIHIHVGADIINLMIKVLIGASIYLLVLLIEMFALRKHYEDVITLLLKCIKRTK